MADTDKGVKKMRTLLFIFLLGLVGSCSGQGMFFYDFEGEYKGLPYFWEVDGDKEITRWSTDHSFSGKYSVALVDQNELSYGMWQSGNLYLDETEREAGKLTLSWYELFNIKTGSMRVSVIFLDDKHSIIDKKHFIVEGQSANWDSKVFSNRKELVLIPEEAVEFNVSIVSGGDKATTGEYYLDDLLIDFDCHTEIDVNNVKDVSRVIASWDMEEKHLVYNDRPVGWEYSGDFPYLATWSNDCAASGKMSLKISDNDQGSHGMWVSERTQLPDDCNEISLSFNFKSKDLKGKWAFSICCYDIPSIHNYSQVKNRIDGQFYEHEGKFIINWSYFNTDGRKMIGSQEYNLSENSDDIFISVAKNLKLPPKTVCLRVASMSGWEPENTGIIWIDDVKMESIN